MAPAMSRLREAMKLKSVVLFRGWICSLFVHAASVSPGPCPRAGLRTCGSMELHAKGIRLSSDLVGS